MDTGICSIDEKYIAVSSDEKAWINQVLRLKEQYPEEVIIKVLPEENSGMIYAWCPREWFRPFKLRPPKQMPFSEMEREKRRQRIMAMHATQ